MYWDPKRERRSHLANNYGPEGLRWTTHTSSERLWCWCRSPPWSMPPPAERRKRPQDGISWVQKVAAVEKCFRGCFWWFGDISEYIGRRIRSRDSRGAQKVGGRALGGGAPTLVSTSRIFWRGVQVHQVGFLPKITSPVDFVPFWLRLIFLFLKTLK